MVNFTGEQDMRWKDTGGGADFEPAPEGTHIARCYQIIDLGTHYNEMFDNYRHQVYVGFEIPGEIKKWKDADGNEQEAPFTVGKFYTMSLNEKANLRHDLESWRGKAFTEQELAGFDPKNVLGAPCMISIIHKTKSEKTRADITSIAKLPKGTECPEQVHDSVYFSLDDYSDESFNNLSKGFQDMVRKSQEFQQQEPAENPAPDEFKDDREIPF